MVEGLARSPPYPRQFAHAQREFRLWRLSALLNHMDGSDGGLSARQAKNILWNRGRQTTMRGVVLAEFLEGRFCTADVWAEICIYMADGWAEIGIRAALLLQTKSGLCGIFWLSKLFFSSQKHTKSNMNAAGEWYTLCGAAVSNLCSWPAAAGLMS